MANEDYILGLGVEASPIADSLDVAINKINEAQAVAASASKKMEGAFSDSANAAEKMNEQIANTTNSIRLVGDSFKIGFNPNSVNSITDATKKFNEELKRTQTEVKKTEKENLSFFQKLKAGYNSVAASVKNVSSSVVTMTTTAKTAGVSLIKSGVDATKGFFTADGMVKKLTGSLVSLGSTAKGLVASTGFLGIFLSLVAAIGYATKEMVNFDKAMTNLAAIAAVPRSALKSLELDIRQVAAESINTANAVADMAMELIKLGATPEGVRKLLRPVNDLSIAFQASADSVAVLLKGTLNAFQESESQANRYADVMAMAANKTALGFNEIAESFTYIAASSNAMGYSVEQTSAMIGVLVDNNIQASSAGRVLSTVFGTLAKQGKTLEGELIKVKNSTDQMATAASLFGAEGARMAVVLANNQDKVKELTEEFENSAGSLATLTEAQLQSVSAGWDIMTSAFTEFVLSVENGTGKISIAIRGILDVITEVFNGLALLNKTAEELADIDLARRRTSLETYVQDEIDSAEKIKETRLKALGQEYTEEERLKDARLRGIEVVEYREEMYNNKMRLLEDERRDRQARGFQENDKRLKAIAVELGELEKEKNLIKQIGAEYEIMSIKKKKTGTGTAELTDEEKRKLEAEIQKTNENLLKFAKEYERSSISIMEDGYERKKALIESNTKFQIEELKLQKLRTQEEIEARDKLILALESQKNNDLEKLDKEHNKRMLMLQIEAQALYLNLQQESMQNEIALMDIDHAKRKQRIEELYKDDDQTRAWLIKNLEESTQREKQKIAQQWGEKEIKAQEELSILSVEMIYLQGKRTAQAEYAKNVEILKIQREFAKQYLDNLIDDGTDEAKVRIAQAEKTILELDAMLKDAVMKTPEIDFWDILGIELTSEEKAALNNALNEMYEGVRSITDAIVSQYDRQLAKKKEVINSLDSDIKKLEKDLDKELQLRENGFANNVELMERELEEKKLQREEELRQMQELEEKKKAMQKAQFLFDSAIQAQNLITSSTNIYKALSPMGPLGIGLAIATIATMMGAFAAQKVEAFNAINKQDVSQFRKGGLLEGNSHERGGVKYYSNDPNSNIKELEGGEYITNTKSTRDYLPLLDAMNTGDFGKNLHNSLAFQKLTRNMGIDLQLQDIGSTIKNARKVQDFNLTIINKTEQNPVFNDMLNALNEIKKHNDNQVQEWEENGKRYIKRNGKTTIIHPYTDA